MTVNADNICTWKNAAIKQAVLLTFKMTLWFVNGGNKARDLRKSEYAY